MFVAFLYVTLIMLTVKREQLMWTCQRFFSLTLAQIWSAPKKEVLEKYEHT